MSVRTRREAMAMLAAGAALARTSPAFAQIVTPTCPAPQHLDSLCAPILSLLPEAAVDAGLLEASAGGPAARRCDDCSPDGNAALTMAVGATRAAIPASGPAARCDTRTMAVRAVLDAAAASADIRYGRNDPLAAIHRPYLVTAFSGPHLSTASSLRLVQDLASPAALDAWQDRLSAYAPALIGAAQALRADEAAGCLPPMATSRAVLPQMDAFILSDAARHPLTQALDRRLAETGTDPTLRAQAVSRAAATLEKHVQPAMAALRDTLAALTRRGRTEIGVWAQTKGEALHAANVARAADTTMSLAEAQTIGREEVERIAAQLDRRLALRGLRKGSIASRIAAAFAAHPEFIESDDEGGRVALLQLAEDREEAARAMLPHVIPGGGLPPLALKALPEAGRSAPDGSFYLPARIDGSRGAELWLDTRSVHALPTPGVSPIAYHLGIPGLHLLAGRAAKDRPLLSRLAAWPAFTQGWACYAERLAAEEDLFARDPWGDIARLSDELLRAARLVTDIGIHGQRWTREQAEAEMTEMTGAAQASAIDRIIALPGEAAGATLGLHRLIDLRDKARATAGRHFDLRQFHAQLVDEGPRPFALVESAIAA